MKRISIIFTAAFAAGITMADFDVMTGNLALLYAVAAGLFVGFLIAVFRWIKAAAILMAALCIVSGLIHALHVSQVPLSDISHLAGQRLTVVGIVSDIPQVLPISQDNVKVRYIINARAAITEQGEEVPVTGGVLININQRISQQILPYGTETVAAGKLTLPHSYGNPGMIDTSAALKRQGITARLSAADGMIRFSDDNSKRHWQNTLSDWRENITKRMEKAMPPETAAILAGTLFGGYAGIPKEVIASFATTGIIHILSVSGTHIALVAAVIFWFGSLFRIRPGIISAWAAFSIVIYALISGCTPPVVRSAIMGIIGLAAVGLGREKDAPTALMIAAFLMLLYQPGLIYDISFQLSFSAAAGLIFLYPKTVAYLKLLPAWLAKPFAVTLAAQLGVVPFIAWYFKSFSLSSFIANLIAIPIIEAAVILGLFTSILGAMLAPANILWYSCSFLINLVVVIIEKLATLPGASIYLPPIGLEAGIAYYCLVAWLYGYRPIWIPSLSDVYSKWFKASTVFSIIITVAFAVYINYPRQFAVHFIDVGQGDAALIITPHRRSILIDSGGTLGEATDFDVGERVVLPYLKHYGILDIDYLILTHGHQDHAGGASAVVSGIPVKNIMIAREEFTPALKKLINATPDAVFIPIYQDQQIMLDGTRVSIILDGIRDQAKSNNESSAVIKVTYGSHSFLFTGDLEAKGEQEILIKKLPVRCSVLKVGHHGSKTSSTPEFLAAVQPQYAVISVGYNNRFGHPHPDVIKRLTERNIETYRTDQHGAIIFQSDGENLHIETFRGLK
ncbi:MAG: DNA internalization-related competence protein ComEC/Rec2 [Veillonellaceae bacterium]|jgi:competence protein ComEC|nr:DNA internalization-related competence protein ComEC/Rec2 [Veillonellaceae bacterium]